MSIKKLIAAAVALTVAVTAFAQKIQVKGTVVDASNQPVIGATVLELGAKAVNGASTDLDGVFVINVPSSAKLQVDCIGYVSQVVDAMNGIVVVLQEDAEMLEDAVAVGYGTQKKRLVTGSTINVSGDLIQKQNTTNALGALYSSVPGVNIVQNSGQSWDGYKITIRGINTTGNSDPLYVVDGVAGASINSLNPADIESIDILKDAASAAIYGARAAAGVVLVTTRQGKKDSKVRISLDASLGFQTPNFNGVSTVGAKEYMQLVTDAFRAAGTVIPEGEYYSDFARENFPVQYDQIMSGKWDGTNWLQESVNKNAPTRNFVVGISGGSDLVRYSLSYSKTYQEGTLGYPKPTYYDRNTIRINTDFSLWRKNGRDIITFGEKTTLAIYDSRGVSTGNIYSNDIHNSLIYTPLLPAYNADGSFYGYEDQLRDGWQAKEGGYNLLENASIGDRENKNYRVNANVYLEINPIKQLKIRSALGYRFNAQFTRSYTPEYQLSGSSFNEFDDVTQSASVSNNYTWENTISYNQNFGDHHVDALFGQSIEGTKWGMSVNGTRQQTTFGTWESANLSSSSSDINADMVKIGGSNTIPYNDLFSFFGRANYSYKDTYLFTAILRADASKNFAPGHRWGVFPSVSAGWIVTNEPWMKNVTNTMSYFKIRGSWGQNGNCSISNFQYSSLVYTDARYDFTQSATLVSPGAYPKSIPNPDLKWETSEQLDFGFDARFFKSRLGVTFDWYRKDTKDWLVDAPALATNGADASTINGGAVRNQGIELAFTWNDRVGDFSYNVGINGSYNHNEILYINNADGILHGGTNVIAQNIDQYNTFEAKPGKPIGYFSGIASEGIFQNQKEIDEWNAAGKTFMDGYEAAKPGDVKWIDQNGDGKFDKEDIVEVGNPHPDFNLGINFSIQWKGIDFSVNGSGAFGQQVVQSYRSFANSDVEQYTNNLVARFWTGEGSTNSFPRFSNGKNNNFYCKGYLGDIWVQNADYFKIRNITIGFDFKKVFKKLPMESLRIFATGQNLFCITGYDGMDPEVGYGYGYSWASGIDIGYYPSPKIYQFGVSIKF